MIINIPVTPLAILCNCVSEECLSSVLVDRDSSFLGDSGVHIYVFGRVLTF